MCKLLTDLGIFFFFKGGGVSVGVGARRWREQLPREAKAASRKHFVSSRFGQNGRWAHHPPAPQGYMTALHLIFFIFFASNTFVFLELPKVPQHTSSSTSLAHTSNSSANAHSAPHTSATASGTPQPRTAASPSTTSAPVRMPAAASSKAFERAIIKFQAIVRGRFQRYACTCACACLWCLCRCGHEHIVPFALRVWVPQVLLVRFKNIMCH